MAAIVSVTRKLLHAIYGMLKHGQDFDGTKFYRPQCCPSRLTIKRVYTIKSVYNGCILTRNL